MKKRWICLFVENEIGVLARISGLFSNVNNLVVVWYQEREYSIKLTEI